MFKILMFIFSMLSVSVVFSAENETERGEKQAELDGICEQARQEALFPTKKKIYQECLDKGAKSESECQQDADSYNGNRGTATPLFYDLPECEAAFNFRKESSTAD